MFIEWAMHLYSVPTLCIVVAKVEGKFVSFTGVGKDMDIFPYSRRIYITSQMHDEGREGN